MADRRELPPTYNPQERLYPFYDPNNTYDLGAQVNPYRLEYIGSLGSSGSNFEEQHTDPAANTSSLNANDRDEFNVPMIATENLSHSSNIGDPSHMQIDNNDPASDSQEYRKTLDQQEDNLPLRIFGNQPGSNQLSYATTIYSTNHQPESQDIPSATQGAFENEEMQPIDAIRKDVEKRHRRVISGLKKLPYSQRILGILELNRAEDEYLSQSKAEGMNLSSQ